MKKFLLNIFLIAIFGCTQSSNPAPSIIKFSPTPQNPNRTKPEKPVANLQPSGIPKWLSWTLGGLGLTATAGTIWYIAHKKSDPTPPPPVIPKPPCQVALETYQGIPIDQTGQFGNLFAGKTHLKIALVGGDTQTGLGQLNVKLELNKPFYLLNIDQDSNNGVSCVLDFTQPLPDYLYNQFDVVFLEQLTVEWLFPLPEVNDTNINNSKDTLVGNMKRTMANAFHVLKPEGILLFNTYRPGDYRGHYSRFPNISAYNHAYAEIVNAYFNHKYRAIKNNQIDLQNLNESTADNGYYLVENNLDWLQFFNMPILQQNIEFQWGNGEQKNNDPLKTNVMYNSGGIYIGQKKPLLTNDN